MRYCLIKNFFVSLYQLSGAKVNKSIVTNKKIIVFSLYIKNS